MKEIHFYTNLTNTEQVSDWDLDNMCIDYFTTFNAIENSDEQIVKTTQICLLRNTWNYIDLGYKVFLHNGSKVFEIKEHMPEIIRDICAGMDISRLLIGGTYFGKIC